jgi:hypothetical protein
VIHAFDLDERARSICRRVARQNDVESRLQTHGKCTPESIENLLLAHSDHALIVMDCEGDEHQLLNPDHISLLSRTDIIVETHRFVHQEIVGTLKTRLSMSHDIDTVQQGGRDPNRCAQAAKFSELDRWLMVDERRAEFTTWLACWTRDFA